MDSHKLGNLLAGMQNKPVCASIDIDTGVLDSDGETIVAKLYATSICEVFESNNEVTIQFEHSSSCQSDAVNVVDVVKAAQQLSAQSEMEFDGFYSESQISQYAEKHGFTVSKTGVKQTGGQFITLKESRSVVMSFMLLGNSFKRIF